MALFCSSCGGVIPDSGWHTCPNRTFQYAQSWPQNYTKIIGCTLCGSTAIDHTERECLRNRQMKPLSDSETPTKDNKESEA